MRVRCRRRTAHAIRTNWQGCRRRVTIEALLQYGHGSFGVVGRVGHIRPSRRAPGGVGSSKQGGHVPGALPSGHKAKIQAGLAQSRGKQRVIPRIRAAPKYKVISSAGHVVRTQPSSHQMKHKARWRLTERGLTLPSSGPPLRRSA